jgi:bacterioferritin-associated ferredoxin
MYVCLCHGVTDRSIREAAARGASTLDALAAETGAGSCCGACRPLALAILQESAGSAAPLASLSAHAAA